MRNVKSPPGPDKALPLLVGLALLILGCAPAAATPPPFRPPGSGAAAATPTIAELFTVPAPTALPATPTIVEAGSSPSPIPPCTDSLRFVQDLNYPDDTPVQSGQRILKDWRVQNDGSCHWDSRYRLHLTGGIEMGTDGVQALYPARAGTQADLQITFIAPDLPGTYRSEWRAYGPSGDPFGDTLYVELVVTP
jgi:Ig-like domain-containing protein